jgi:hypothetical protein
VAGLVAELDDSHPYEFLKRLTDVYRLHLFDVVMQYRAIFADDAPPGGGASDGGILHVWAQRRVSAYLQVRGGALIPPPRSSTRPACAACLLPGLEPLPRHPHLPRPHPSPCTHTHPHTTLPCRRWRSSCRAWARAARWPPCWTTPCTAAPAWAGWA